MVTSVWRVLPPSVLLRAALGVGLLGRVCLPLALLGGCRRGLLCRLSCCGCGPRSWGLAVVLGSVPASCVVVAALWLRRACPCLLVVLRCCGLLARLGLHGLCCLLCRLGHSLLLWLVVEVVLTHGDVTGWRLPRSSLSAPGVQRGEVSCWLLWCLCPLSLPTSASGSA